MSILTSNPAKCYLPRSVIVWQWYIGTLALVQCHIMTVVHWYSVTVVSQCRELTWSCWRCWSSQPGVSVLLTVPPAKFLSASQLRGSPPSLLAAGVDHRLHPGGDVLLHLESQSQGLSREEWEKTLGIYKLQYGGWIFPSSLAVLRC